MKKFMKGKWRLLSIICASITLACLVSVLVLGLTVDLSKPKDKTNTAGTETTYNQAYFDTMLADSKRVDASLFTWVDHTAATAPDGKTAGRWFTGLNMNSTYWSSISYGQYFSQHPTLVIPEEYNGSKIVGVDLYSCSSISDLKEYSLYHYIKAIVVPDSVKYITSGSFNNFSNLEYLKIPFVGTSRGSSGRGMNYDINDVSQKGGSTTPTSDCFASMFGDPFDYDTASGANGGWTPATHTSFWVKWDGTGTYNPSVVDNVEYLGYYTQTDISTLTPAQKAKAALVQVKWQEISSEVIQSPAFYYVIPRSLQWVIVSDDEKIGNNAFTGCTARHIEIHDFKSSSFEFGTYAFSECLNLKEVKLPTQLNVFFREGTFSMCQSLEKVILPPALTNIPKGFLDQAISLKEVYMPASITEIEDGAFKDCQLLEKIALYSGNTSQPITGNYKDPTSEENLDASIIIKSTYEFNLPSGLTKIGADAFRNCQNLVNLSVPEGVKTIGYAAFGGCVNLKKMILPFIGAHAGGCSSTCSINNLGFNKDLHGLFGWVFGQVGGKENFYTAQQYYNSSSSFTFQIPSSLEEVTIRKETTISTGAFQNVSSLVTLSINPEVGNSITNGFLNGCSNLKTLTISSVGNHLGNLFAGSEFDGSITTSGSARVPGNLTTVKITNQPDVSGSVFHNCTKLQNVEIGNATRYIGASVFYNNQSLKSLTLPFVGCERGEFYRDWWWWRDKAWRNTLQWIFSSTYHTGTYENNSLRYYDSYIRYIPSSLKSVTITDESVIGYYSFRNFRSLESISITNLPSSIAEGSFYGCSGLTELQLPYIGHDLNKNGYSGREHVLGYIFGTASYSGSYGVSQYSTYYIPNQLKSVKIGYEGRAEANMSNRVFDYAFNGCSSLTSVDFYGAYINILGNNAFANCVNLSKVNYPNANFSHVGNYAFYNCKKVQAVEDFTPNTVHTIGNYAFYGTAVGFKDPDHRLNLDNYTSIGNYAFANCLQIEKIKLPAHLGTNIGDGVFSGCQYLTDVNLEDNNHVTKYMFANCTSLEAVDLTGVIAIPEGLFSGCVNLLWDNDENKGFIYDDSTYYIGPYAFRNCRSLDDFQFTSALRTIDTGAFQGCTGIEYMTIPNETKTINPQGWIGCNDNFFFYVWSPEEDWSKGWVTNWNCDYPVYYLGNRDEDVYTYSYNQQERKWYITGLTGNATLSGIITIPSTHLGGQVVGIDESLEYSDDDIEKGRKPIKTQTGITKVILPKSVTKIVGSPFATGSRVDIYTELTKAEVTSIYNNSVKSLEAEYVDWLQKNINASNEAKANQRTKIYDKLKGWMPFAANAEDGICKAVDGENPWDSRYWTSGGMLYYKDYWQFGTGANFNLPYLKINTFKYTLTQFDSHYTSAPIIQNLQSVQLPGELFANDGLGIDTTIMYIYDMDVFTKQYLNNVNVGTATINIGINTDVLREYNAEIAEERFDDQHPYLFTGTTTLHYTILKSALRVNGISGLMVEKEYDGEYYSYSTWLDSQILGLEGFQGAVFTGTLRTPSADAGDYYANQLVWSTPWKVTLKGIDISQNFDLQVLFMVRILRMKVELVWAKSNQLINGVYQLTDVDPNKYTDDNGAQLPLVYYPYIGGPITPYAVARKVNGGQFVPRCKVIATHQDPNNYGIYPYGEKGARSTYLIYAYIDPSVAKNYILQAQNDAGEWYTPTVILSATNTIEGIRAAYRVTKGLINIDIDIDYVISPTEDYWSHQWGLELKGSPLDPDKATNDRTYITGLGANSRFVGKLASTKDLKSIYTLNSSNSGHIFESTVDRYLTWKDLSFYYQNGTFVVNYTADETNPYCIYNPTLGEVDESMYYDVVVNGRVQILYNQFKLTYFIGVDDPDYDANRYPNYIVDTETIVETTEGNPRYYEYVQYEVDGNFYKLSVEDWTAFTNRYPNYVVNYYKDDGASFNDDFPTFREIGTYVFAVQLSARHYDTVLKNIKIDAVKSNVRVGDLSKVYDREPVDPLGEGKILKIGEDQKLNLTFTWYDARGNKLPSAPVDAGSYSVRIYAPEGEFFNEYDQIHYFEISQRKIYITITGSKMFDRDPYIYTPISSDMVTTENNPDEGLLPGDEFTGIVQTADAVPGLYSSNKKDNFGFIWSPMWAVFYTYDTSNVTKNYLLVFDAEYEILPLEFVFTAEGYEGDYDGDFHTGNVIVTYPTATDYYPAYTPDYKVYYALSSLSENSSGWLTNAPVFSDPGEYKLYYMIRADYFKTVIGYVVIKINPLTIEYVDPATTDTDNNDNYWTVQYTSMSYTYEIEVLSPRFSAVVYYSLDGVNYTTEAPMFLDYGNYDVYYRIEAPYHETVGPIHRIVRIKINLDDDDDDPGQKLEEGKDYLLSFFRGEYDGQPHTLEASFVDPTAFEWINITYSLDDGKTWTREKPSFVELGKHKVTVKFSACGYLDTIRSGYVEITGMLMDIEPVSFECTFDGKYHMVGLTSATGTLRYDEDLKVWFYDNGRGTGEVELKFSYTTNPNITSGTSGWSPTVAIVDGVAEARGFKDVGVYAIYVMLEAENFETEIFEEYVKLTINRLENPDIAMESPQFFEYSKSQLDGSKIEIETVADGARSYYYYSAYKAGDEYKIEEPMNRILPPQELGVYYVTIKVAASKNCGPCEISGFIEIVPRVLIINYTNPQYYDGTLKTPGATAETGTSDVIHILTSVQGTSQPIEVGIYTFDLFMVENNPNYVLPYSTIDMEIKKRSILINLEEEHLLKDDFEPWVETDSEFYDKSAQCGDNKWHLLGDLSGERTVYIDGEEKVLTYSGLASNHILYLELETNNGVRGSYFYSTITNEYYINRVKVKDFNIYQGDSQGNFVYEDGEKISVLEYYDVDFYLLISLVNPDINLDDLLILDEYDYDGASHTIQVTLPSYLTGGFVRFENNGRYGSIPPKYINVGEYEIKYYIGAYGYEDTYGTATLKIKPATLDIRIGDLYKVGDGDKTKHEIYDDTPHINSYELMNILTDPMPKATHQKYYDAKKYTYKQILEFYQNFDAASNIYASGLDRITEAGNYICVVYYEEDILRWKESFSAVNVLLKPRDIFITITETNDYIKTYDGTKLSIPLTHSTIDTTYTDTSGLLPHHNLDVSLEAIKWYTVQTNSADAGVYDLKTDLEFGAIDITTQTGKPVASSNYHPVVLGDFLVEILKAYLRDGDFTVEEYLEKVYDGYRHEPNYTCISDGELILKYFDYDTGNPLFGNQKNAGHYTVQASIGEGKNYHSLATSYATFDEDNNRYFSSPYLVAEILCLQLEVEVKWENKEVTFNGYKQDIKPYFEDNETDHENTIRVDLVPKYWDNTTYDWIYSVVHAGTYLASTEFDLTTVDGQTYARNYVLKNTTCLFNIKTLTLRIQLGDGGSSNNIVYYNTQTAWRANIYKVSTPGAAEILSDTQFIQDWLPTVTISSKASDTQPAYVMAMDYLPGTYKGGEQFIVNCKVVNNDGVEITNSINYEIVGSVTVKNDEIDLEARDVTLPYKEVKNSSVVGYTFSELNCLTVKNPRSGYTVGGFVINGVPYGDVFPNLSQAGTYDMYYDVLANGYTAVRAHSVITITPFPAYMTFTRSLTKTYDGSAVNVSSLISSSSSGYNGTVLDLNIQYFELVYEDGGYSQVELDAAPINVGNYIVRITSSVDESGASNLNYTTLDITQRFDIIAKRLNLVINEDHEILNDDKLNKPWNSGLVELNSGSNSGISSGDLLQYEISTESYQRGKFYATETLNYDEESALATGSSVKTFSTVSGKKFTIAWRFVMTDDQGKIVYEERVNPDYDTEQPEGPDNEPTIRVMIDKSKNYYITLTYDVKVHYPYIPVEIKGYEDQYDGNYHSGTITFGSYKSKDGKYNYDATWFMENATQYYATSQQNLDDLIDVEQNIANIKYKDPCSNAVFYSITIPSTVTDAKFEPYVGTYTIQINKLERHIEVENMNKEYDTLPAGIIKGGTEDRFFPNYTIWHDDESISDDIDIDKVEIEYKQAGVKTPIDATIGCIDSGSYQYTLTIPATKYYKETVVNKQFMISKVKIYISNNPDVPSAYSYDGLVKSIPIDENSTRFDISTKANGASDFTPLYASGLSFAGTLITKDKQIGTYSGLDSTLTLLNHEYLVLDDTGEDVSTNYLIDISGSTIQIKPIDMVYEVLHPTYIYDNQDHEFAFHVTTPTNMSLVTVEWYDDVRNAWTTTPITKRDVGDYTVTVKLSALNYTDALLELPMTIERAETVVEYVSNLTRVYDGNEVTMPEIIKTNRDNAGEANLKDKYEYKYYEYVDGNLSPQPMYTQYYDEELQQAVGSGERPVNVGKYRIVITIPESKNFKAATYTQDFDISGYKTNITWQDLVFTYDGTPKSPKAYLQLVAMDRAQGKEVHVVLKLSISPSVGTTDVTHTNKGAYIATATIDLDASDPKAANYLIDDATKSATFVIQPRPLNVVLNYPQAIYLGDADYIMRYNMLGLGGYSFTATNLVPNHKITDYLKLNYDGARIYSDPSDFTWMDGTSNIPITSMKILDEFNNQVTDNYLIAYSYLFVLDEEITDSAVSITNYDGFYDGDYHTFEIELLADNPDSFTIEYWVYGQSKSWSAVKPSRKDVGTDQVSIRIQDKSGEIVFTGTARINIKKADPEIQFDDVNISLGKEYDGVAIKNPLLSYNGSVINPSQVEYVYYKVNDDDTTTQLPVGVNPVDAGKYHLVATVPASQNYNKAVFTTADFVITPRTINIYISKDSKPFDYLSWTHKVVESEVERLVPGHKLRLSDSSNNAILMSTSPEVGDYQLLGVDPGLQWQNGFLRIYDAAGNEVNNPNKQNYTVNLSADASITARSFDVEFKNVTVLFDEEAHSIYAKINGTKKSDGTVDPRVYVNDFDEDVTIEYAVYENGAWNYDETLISKINIGTYSVRVRISAPNYETVVKEARLSILDPANPIPPDDPENPDNPDDPDDPDGPSDADYDPYLEYDKDKVYDKLPYNDPIFTPLPTGDHDVKYYDLKYYLEHEDDLNPDMAISNPINAGSYVFVFTVDTSSPINPGKVYKQGFKIFPRPVDVVWENLSFQYEPGVQHIPTAYYLDIDENKVMCTVKEPMESKGVWPATAETSDTNYSLTGFTTDFVITANLIKDVVLTPDQEFEFGKPIIITDVDGNIYIRKEDYDEDPSIVTDRDHTLLVDNDGNLLKYDPSQDKWVDADLPYTMTIDADPNAGEHKVTISLKNPVDNAWENHGTDDIVETFYIDPIEFPNEDYELIYDYKDLWIYNGFPIEPSPKDDTFKIIIHNLKTDEKIELDPQEYELSYNNNVNPTTEDNKAEIIIKANGNYIIDDIQYFTITPDKPDVLELKDDALIQFITATYDPELGAQIVEDGSVEHISKDDENLYLGHLHQTTSIKEVLAQFKNDPDKLVVKNQYGVVISEDSYEDLYFGSGFTVVLLDDSDNEIDQVQAILYGDLNGDGFINAMDIVEAQTYVEFYNYDSVDEYYYFTGIVDRTTPTFSAPTIVAIQAYTEFGSNDSSVDFNTFDGKYPQTYVGTAS